MEDGDEYRSLAGRVVMAITSTVVVVIVLGIALVLLDANEGNGLVNFVLDLARWLTTPFRNLFVLRDADNRVLVNWGLAAVVYLLAGSALARFAGR